MGRRKIPVYVVVETIDQQILGVFTTYEQAWRFVLNNARDSGVVRQSELHCPLETYIPEEVKCQTDPRW